MGVILREAGFRFFFYSNEHGPAHVHVIKAGGEAVFELWPEVMLRESAGLKVRELRKAETLVLRHRAYILRKWNEHLDR